MWNMFRCEMKKLLRCRAFYFLILASFGCGALSVWVLNGGIRPERYGSCSAGRGSVSGLGLSIVRLLTEQMGGDVRAELQRDTLALLVSLKKWPET